MKNIYRIILALSLCLTCTTMRSAEVKDTLWIAPFSATPGVTAEDDRSFSIMMENNDSIWGVQFDIRLPEGMGFAQENTPFVMNKTRFPYDEDGGKLTFRHSMIHRTMADGWTRVLIYSMNPKLYIQGNSGEILRVAYTTDASLPDTTCAIALRNVSLAITGAKDSKPMNADTQVRISSLLAGDANSDGEVNVGDLSAIVGYILNTNVMANFNVKAADANGDNEVNVGDLSTIVKIILGISNQ